MGQNQPGTTRATNFWHKNQYYCIYSIISKYSIVDSKNQNALKSCKVLTKKKKLDDLPLSNFPLRTGQLGYMNIALQKFSGFNNKQICYNSNTDKKLKKNEFCIVRMGIEKNKNQSFLCLLAAIYKKYNKFDKDYLTNEVESLQEFKEYFIENLTVDKFVIAKNGNLVNIFETDSIEAVDISKYGDSVYLTNIKVERKRYRKF